MKKTFILEDLCCANCAAKIEDGVSKLDGVTAVSVAFLTQKMKLEYDDSKEASVIEAMEKIVKKVDADINIVEK